MINDLSEKFYKNQPDCITNFFKFWTKLHGKPGLNSQIGPKNGKNPRSGVLTRRQVCPGVLRLAKSPRSADFERESCLAVAVLRGIGSPAEGEAFDQGFFGLVPKFEGRILA